MSKFSRLLPGILVLCSATPALAYEPGDVIVRTGPIHVAPQDDSSVLNLDGTRLPGTGAKVDDDTQLGLAVTYMFKENWGIELLAATPFTHTVDAKGLGLEVGEVDHLPPTVSLQYYPMRSGSAFQPYVGLGLNYTTFFKEDLSSEFVAALGDGDMKLDDSFGLALQVGADYAITDNLVLNASIWAMDIDTDARIKLDSGQQIKVDVDIDPVVFMVGLGYRF